MSQVTAVEIHEAVREYFASEMPEHAASLEQVDPDASLFKLGLLDSLSFLGLVEFIEGRFGIVVPPTDFAQTRWGSLNLMSAYVVNALAAQR